MKWSTYHSAISTITIVALLHQYLQKELHWQLPYLHSYLDDVLCLPLFLALWRWERKHFWRAASIYPREIFIFVLIVFFLFEGIVPRYSPHFTADWWDGVAYGTGGILFWLLQPQESINTASS